MSPIATFLRCSVAAAALLTLSGASWAGNVVAPAGGSAPIFFDPAQPVAARADDLISRMTLEEKASQLVNQARPIPRLGIPAYNWWSEALHGVARAGIATVFPEPVGLAASFDPTLIHEMAEAISVEGRVKNNIALRQGRHAIYEGLTFWSPNINIFRDPRWGRGQETYGEDPYLTGKMGYAFITGMQGDDPKYLRTVATPKHFAVHSGPEPTRHEVDVAVSKHDMMDTYLPAFRTAIVEAKAESIMCAYNRVNGQPACASDFLLTDMLKTAWSFRGFVVSDCDAVADIARGHHYTRTEAEAAAVSLAHGTDNDCADFATPTRDASDYQRYVDAVREGLVPEATLDASLRRLLSAQLRLGLYDPPAMVKYRQIPDSELDSPAHRALALKTARETMVLLKNDGLLPLDPAKVKSVAVVGALADQDTVLRGNYNGVPSHAVTALDGIRQAFPNAKVTFEPGTNFLRATTVVPAAMLSTAQGTPGLTAEFFASRDFSGTPVLTRTDATVNYDMDVQANLPANPDIAVRWTGFLTPTESGDYALGLWGPAGRLYLDGQTIVAVGHRQKSGATGRVHLEAGRKYAIRIERDYGPNAFLSLKLVWTKQLADPLTRAVAAARAADVVVAVVGITSQLEGEEMTVTVPGFSGGDRTSLDLPKEEEDLLKAVKATGRKLAVVLYNGSPLAVNWADRNADAILDAWYPGEEGGTAIGEVLSGAYNPAGRLPVTFYTGVDQLPPFEDYAMAGRTYRYFKGKPLYPFGYGLSYTRFVYSGLKLSQTRLAAGTDLSVAVTVKNVGARAGDEVAQLYLTFPKVPGAPIRALRGFERVHLAAGEAKRLRFTLSPRDLGSVTPAGDVVVAGGAYTLSVGGGQPTKASATVAAPFAVVGTAPLAP